MKKIIKSKKEKCDCKCGPMPKAECGVYGVGIVGAAVYFIGQSSTFGAGVVGFLKALVWPAFLVHGLFQFLVK